MGNLRVRLKNAFWATLLLQTLSHKDTVLWPFRLQRDFLAPLECVIAIHKTSRKCRLSELEEPSKVVYFNSQYFIDDESKNQKREVTSQKTPVRRWQGQDPVSGASTPHCPTGLTNWQPSQELSPPIRPESKGEK